MSKATYDTLGRFMQHCAKTPPVDPVGYTEDPEVTSGTKYSALPQNVFDISTWCDGHCTASSWSSFKRPKSFILQADEGGTGRGGGEGEQTAARRKKQCEKGKDHAAHRE